MKKKWRHLRTRKKGFFRSFDDTPWSQYLRVRAKNLLEQRKQPYTVMWVEDLPAKTHDRTIYILGGRRHPHYAVVPCPSNKCDQQFHLPISEQFEDDEQWDLKEHSDGSITLSPSIHLSNLPCRCHYWIREGKTVWSTIPRAPFSRRKKPRKRKH